MIPDARTDREYETFAKEQRDLKAKPLDLSALLRDAFLAGRGLKDGDKLSKEDQAAWMAYDPERIAAYRRVSMSLYGRV